MSDLISRQDALIICDKYYREQIRIGNYSADSVVWNVADELRNLPAADPVKHGKWEYRNIGGWHCSVCDEQAPFWCMASTQNLSKYCPNCGAKMDGEEE